MSSSSSSSSSSPSSSSSSSSSTPTPYCKCPPCRGNGESPNFSGSGGVNTFTGRVLIDSSAGISSRGFGIPFGTALYYDSQGGGAAAGFGPNWLSGQLASLSFAGNQIYYRTSATRTVQFTETSLGSGVYKASYFVRDVITRSGSGSATVYTLLKADGSRETFDSTGRITGMTSAGGVSATYTYDGTSGELQSVSATSGGDSWDYAYAWADGKVSEITYKVNGRSVVKTAYGYSETTGNLETIKKSENSNEGTGSPVWGDPVEATRYSYHSSGLLRHVVPPAEYRQMQVNGIDPDDADDSELSEYTETEYEYGGGNRVSKMYTHGRRYEYEFSYTPGSVSGNVFNTWRMKTEVKKPGEVVETFYLNGVGQVILKRVEQKDSGGTVLDTWYPVFQKFQEDGGARIVLSAAASAIDAESFSETKGSLVDLKPTSGLVTEYFYNVQGLLHYTQQREGTTGQTARLKELTYEERTVSGLGTIWPVKTEEEFRNADGTGDSTTSYAYEWHSGTAALQPSKITTTLPLVPTSENGPNASATTERHFDTEGYLTKSVDAVGTATTYTYDKLRGGVLSMTQDEGTGKLNLVTDYQLDDQGRTIRELGPQHTIDLDDTATPIRSAKWTYYKDRAGEIWNFGGYRKVSDSSDNCVGAVRVERRNVSGARPTGKSGWRMDYDIAVRYSGGGIPSDSATFDTLFPRSTWESWKIGLYDKSSELREEWTYFTIPSGTSFGTVDVDYGNKRYDYDVAGRQNQTTCAGNTTERTNYNAVGWVVSEELGIDANPETYTVIRSNNEHDDDGNVKKVTLPVDENDTNGDRVTDYHYDWRGRLETVETRVQKDPPEGSGDWTLITKYVRDNRGLVTSEAKYHTAVTSNPATNRTGLSEMDYDSRGRLYRTRVYAVASNGTTSNPQTSNRFYDGEGRLLKDAPAGSKLFTATDYDVMGRPEKIYQAFDTGTPPSVPPFVAGATVMEQTENEYDDGGNLTYAILRRRYDDATNSGPLKDASAQPKARVSYRGIYPDALGRTQATADFGTSGSSVTIPPRSATVRVTSYQYTPVNQVAVETDPAGIHTCRTWDKAGRLVKVVENCSGGSSSSSSSSSSGAGSVGVRTTRYEYTSDSWLKKLISDNAATGPQTTEWVYGVTKGTGATDSRISSKRLVYQKLFPGAAQPVTYSYNAQLQVTHMTDQLGTAHAYGYDKLGRLLTDTVGTFGTGVDKTIGKLENGYNNRGLLVRAASYNELGTAVLNEIAWDYNDFNQPVAEYQEHDDAVNKTTSLKVGYTYADGSANTTRPTGIKYPHVGTGGATTVAIEYDGPMADALSRPDQIKDGTAILSSWRYVGLGMVAAQKYDAASDTELTYGDSSNGYDGYDRFGGIAATLWKKDSDVLVESSYGRNAVGGVVWRKDVRAHAIPKVTQDNFYAYDGLHQVRRHDRGELSGSPPYTGITNLQQEEDFTYDETGNWKGYQSTAPSLVQSRTHNVANQITDITDPTSVVDPAYDGAGNMTTMPSPGDWIVGYTCTWDAWNRLKEIKEGTTVVGAYTYDALTRRIRKTADNETRDYYYNKQWRALEERESGSATADYTYSPFDRWNLIRRRRSNTGTLDEIRYVLRDYLDPVAIIEEDNGTVTVDERYGYDAFGPVRIMDKDFGDRGSSVCEWNWLFHGEFLDAESGLYNYGYRYYHPQLGRWISRDPIGERGGLNLYAYVLNDGVKLLDVLGREPVTPDDIELIPEKGDSDPAGYGRSFLCDCTMLKKKKCGCKEHTCPSPEGVGLFSGRGLGATRGAARLEANKKIAEKLLEACKRAGCLPPTGRVYTECECREVLA